MEKVDRLGWAAGVTISPAGTRIGIRINDEAHLPLLEKLVSKFDYEIVDEEVVNILISLRVGPKAKKGRKNYHLVYLGVSRVIRTLDLDEALTYLEESLPQIVRSTASNAVFIPGSIVSLEDGLLVLPAAEGTGRRTLLKELKKKGGEVLSDSFFAISPEGELRLSDGEKVGVEAVPLVCFTEYSKRNKTLRAKTLTPGESSLYLFSSGVSSRSQPAVALGAVSSFATKALNLRGKRGEARQAADYLSRKLSKVPSHLN